VLYTVVGFSELECAGMYMLQCAGMYMLQWYVHVAVVCVLQCVAACWYARVSVVCVLQHGAMASVCSCHGECLHVCACVCVSICMCVRVCE